MKSVVILLAGVVLVGGLRARAEAPGALEGLERGYAEDRAAALRRVLARYADELAVLEGSLVAAKDEAGAGRVRVEREGVLAALGLPAVEAVEADDFAAFEEVVEVPVPLVPSVLPKDLAGTVRSLLPPGVSRGLAAAAPAVGGTGAGSGGRRLLRMATAERTGVYDAASGYEFWTQGKSASWIVEDVAAGNYRVVLRYACDEKDGGGGKVMVQMGSVKLEVALPGTGGWTRRRELVVGPFAVSAGRVDVVVKAASLAEGGRYLMDFTALQVQPLSGPGLAPPP